MINEDVDDTLLHIKIVHKTTVYYCSVCIREQAIV